MKLHSVKLFFILGTAVFGLSDMANAQSDKTKNTNISVYRCQPNQPCWPTDKEWQAFKKSLKGRLLKPQSSLSLCQKDTSKKLCKKALKNLSNPFVIEDNPGDTQSQGWMNAWQSSPSIYAVEAINASDVSEAVNFARKHHLRIVIKGTGHDYLGRSNAPNSLLIWTHKMRDIDYTDSFVPTGCNPKTTPISAITFGAGTRWLEAYDVATNQHDKYVQGGGCTTVGAAGGFPQGGGFGQFSKQYGTGAAGIAQVEIVTADGKILTANECQNTDLFWAVRGGGGGTFGVVTKMTLKTHPLPKTLGLLTGSITAKNDQDYKTLINHFISFYRDNLNNAHWGEQIKFDDKNTIHLFVMYQGLDKYEALNTFNPLKEWAHKQEHKYKIKTKVYPIESNKLWNMDYMKKHHSDLVTVNKAPGAKKGEYWWTPNSEEVSSYWFTYQSWWLPERLLSDKNSQKLSDAIFKASRLNPVVWHINKGLAGASKEAIAEGKKTSTNPTVYDATALIIMSARTNKDFIGVKNKEPDLVKGKEKVEKISAAIKIFRDLAPDMGTYANEADYFMTDWQNAFWGKNYPRLLSIKKQYDPDGLFYCHHCVGSELLDEAAS